MRNNGKSVKAVLVAVLFIVSIVTSGCDNLIRDVVLVPEGGHTCAGGSWGMPCDNK